MPSSVDAVGMQYFRLTVELVPSGVDAVGLLYYRLTFEPVLAKFKTNLVLNIV